MKAKTHAYWKNHFSTIGIVGMNECCMNFLGKGIITQEGKKFAEEVLDFMRAELEEYQIKSGNMYNLEATPAEGTSYRLAKLDKECHTGCCFSNGDEVPMYTNSSQLPVNATDDIWELISHQESLQAKYTGGTVVHTFVGEKISDPEATKQFIKRVFEQTAIPYLTITPTFSVCPTHGYLSGEHKYCPKCDEAILSKKNGGTK
jgi:ribonucleoside-triphosphate reductase